MERCQFSSYSTSEKNNFKNKTRTVDGDAYSNVYFPPKENLSENISGDCEPITASETTNKLDFTKMNVLNKNIYNDFSKEWGKASVIASGLTQAYNNPYIEGVQIASEKMEKQDSSKEISSKSRIISLLKRLKSLYLDKSLSSQLNQERLKKFNTLISYFLKNDDDSWQVNNKGVLIYNNIETGVKFAKYVDYFIKTPAERSSVSKPLYYDELFNVKITREQSFSPMIQKSRGYDHNKHTSLHRASPANDEENRSFKRGMVVNRGDESTQTQPTNQVSKHSQKEWIGQSALTQTETPTTISMGSQKNDDMLEKIQNELSLLKQVIKTRETELQKQIALNISLEELNSLKVEEDKILKTMTDAASQTSTKQKTHADDKLLDSIAKADDIERTEKKLWSRIDKLQQELDVKKEDLDKASELINHLHAERKNVQVPEPYISEIRELRDTIALLSSQLKNQSDNFKKKLRKLLKYKHRPTVDVQRISRNFKTESMQRRNERVKPKSTKLPDDIKSDDKKNLSHQYDKRKHEEFRPNIFNENVAAKTQRLRSSYDRYVQNRLMKPIAIKDVSNSTRIRKQSDRLKPYLRDRKVISLLKRGKIRKEETLPMQGSSPKNVEEMEDVEEFLPISSNQSFKSDSDSKSPTSITHRIRQLKSYGGRTDLQSKDEKEEKNPLLKKRQRQSRLRSTYNSIISNDQFTPQTKNMHDNDKKPTVKKTQNRLKSAYNILKTKVQLSPQAEGETPHDLTRLKTYSVPIKETNYSFYPSEINKEKNLKTLPQKFISKSKRRAKRKTWDKHELDKTGVLENLETIIKRKKRIPKQRKSKGVMRPLGASINI